MVASSTNFAVLGVGGYVAPRHLQAIHDIGGRLVAAADPHDSVGVLDRYSFDAPFFTDIDRLDRHLEKLRQGPASERAHYVAVCSPNYLHDAHCRLALRLGADVICEKPLVINPWNLDALERLEQETGRRVFTVLQLRLHPLLVQLREQMTQAARGMYDVELTYVTSRGPWYDVSWKGSTEKSGGVSLNIGIHLFDLVLWLFGAAKRIAVHVADPRRSGGVLECERARVRWFLSTDHRDLGRMPVGAHGDSFALANVRPRSTFRSIKVDGKELEFSQGFAELHTRVYERIMSGEGFRIADARPSIELVHRIRSAEMQPKNDAHPSVQSLFGS